MALGFRPVAILALTMARGFKPVAVHAWGSGLYTEDGPDPSAPPRARLSCTTPRELRLSNMSVKKVAHSIRFCTPFRYLDLSCNRIGDPEAIPRRLNSIHYSIPYL